MKALKHADAAKYPGRNFHLKVFRERISLGGQVNRRLHKLSARWPSTLEYCIYLRRWNPCFVCIYWDLSERSWFSTAACGERALSNVETNAGALPPTVRGTASHLQECASSSHRGGSKPLKHVFTAGAVADFGEGMLEFMYSTCTTKLQPPKHKHRNTNCTSLALFLKSPHLNSAFSEIKKKDTVIYLLSSLNC